MSDLKVLIIHCSNCKNESHTPFHENNLIVWDDLEVTGSSGVYYEFECSICGHTEDISGCITCKRIFYHRLTQSSIRKSQTLTIRHQYHKANQRRWRYNEGQTP